MDNNYKNIVILKNLPSNILEEAIIVVKDKKNTADIDYLKKMSLFNYSNMKEDDFNRLKNIPKESRTYVIKEAESVIKNYIEKIEDGRKVIARNRLKKKYNRLKYINFILLIISILSTILCIIWIKYNLFEYRLLVKIIVIYIFM